jgi:hypothetical protein
MPGASALKAANYIAAVVPRDGTVIAGTHSNIITAALASNKQMAVKFAIMKFKISDTEHQNRLVAELRD